MQEDMFISINVNVDDFFFTQILKRKRLSGQQGSKYKGYKYPSNHPSKEIHDLYSFIIHSKSIYYTKSRSKCTCSSSLKLLSLFISIIYYKVIDLIAIGSLNPIKKTVLQKLWLLPPIICSSCLHEWNIDVDVWSSIFQIFKLYPRVYLILEDH
jgi:hypothetical protein